MTRYVRTETVAPVALLTIENPPVNALNDGVWAAIDAAVAAAAADPSVGAIVLIGGGTTFVAGADIKVFTHLKTTADAMARTEWTHAMLRRLEDTPKPLIAAMHGHALGGGLELALACHFRVAAVDTRLGQPEVRLGIVPGAGGTQRLPRLVGPALALRMCTDGASLTAPQAAEAGLIDHIAAGDLRSSALGYARAKAVQGHTRPTREIALSPDAVQAGLVACEATRTTLARTARGQRAPFAAVDAIEAGLRLPFDEGAIREREIFAACVTSVESRALRHLFFAERSAAKRPAGVAHVATPPIRYAAVIGAGTMGTGIAMAYANAGLPVVLKDVDTAALDRAMTQIARQYDTAVAKGRLDAQRRDRTMALITPMTTFDEFPQVDIVIEAVFEDLALKQRTFADVARVTREDCVLASNTSTLDIDALADASGRPGQVVGHHFFSPANVMTLLEIVRGRQTSDAVLAASLAIAKQLGKSPVIVGNCFGFVANRMLAYYLREALLLLEEGASVEQIDSAMTAFGLPVGPFGMQDIAGIDVVVRIRQHLAAMGRTWASGPQSAIPDQLVAMGRYGQKTQAGWYRYEPGSRDRFPDPLIDELAQRAATARGISRGTVDDDEIVARIMTALVNEGACILDDGMAQRPGDIDVVYCHGFGFPRARGGPLFYAHTRGLEQVLAQVRDYRARFGDYWTPAPLLERLVADGRSWYDE